jgi:hypothetical protein
MDSALEQLCHPKVPPPLGRRLLRWQGYREIAEFVLARGADANAGTHSRLKTVRTLGYMPPAAPPGDSDRRYMVATVAIRTQARIGRSRVR